MTHETFDDEPKTAAEALQQVADDLTQAALDFAPGVHVTDGDGEILPGVKKLLRARAVDLRDAADEIDRLTA